MTSQAAIGRSVLAAARRPGHPPLRPRNLARAQAIAMAAEVRDRVAGALVLDTKGITRKTEGRGGNDDAELLRLQWLGTQGHERKRMIAALREAGDNQLADRLAECSATFATYARADGKARVQPHRCDHAVCPRCVGHRTRATRERYEQHAARVQAEGGRIRFVTLTQPVREGEGWKKARARLLRQWARFWRRADAKKKITGGLRRIETTWATRCQGGHVHIHLAFEGSFWAHAELVEAWSESGEGISVRINEAYDSAELFKYLLKTAKAPHNRLVEYAHETKGVRNLEFLGTWRKPVADVVTEGDDDDKRPMPFFPVNVQALTEAAAMDADAARWRLALYGSTVRGQLADQADALQQLAEQSAGVRRVALVAEAERVRARSRDPDLAAWARAVLAARSCEMDARQEREHRRLQGELRRQAARDRKSKTVARSAPCR